MLDLVMNQDRMRVGWSILLADTDPPDDPDDYPSDDWIDTDAYPGDDNTLGE